MGRINQSICTVQVTDGVTDCTFRYYKPDHQTGEKPLFVLAVEFFNVTPSDWNRLVYLALAQIANLEGLELNGAVFLLTNTHIDSPKFHPGTSWTDYVTPDVQTESVVPSLILKEPALPRQIFADLIGQHT